MTTAGRKPPDKSLRAAVRASLWLVLLLAAAYGYFWLFHPMGGGTAGPAVPREPFAAPWTGRPVQLLGFGDSMTAGFGSSAGRSYFERLARNPPDEFPDMRGLCLSAVLPRFKAENHSVSGSTSPQHLKYQIDRLTPRPPDVLGVVVMTTGGNDLIHSYGRRPPEEAAMYGATLAQAGPWIAAFGERLDAMLVHLEQRLPGGCELFLANIYDPTDGIGDARSAGIGLPDWPEGLQVIRAYNQELEKFAGRRANVHLVDIRSTFLGHGIHCRQFWQPFYQARDPHYWYYINLEDPNDRGYDAIRRLFLIQMSRARERLR